MLHNQIVAAPALTVLQSIPDRTIAAVISDPPFFINVGRRENWGQDTGFGQDEWEKEVSTVEEAIRWTEPHAAQICRILRPGGGAVIMGGSQSLAAWEIAASRVGLCWMAEISVLWNSGKPRARNFGGLTTAIRWYVKPGARHAFNAGMVRAIYSNVLVARKVPLGDRLHPAQKPVELTNVLVSLLTNEGDTVVDPFAGAGSTLVSAASLDRVYIGAEIDADIAAIAEKRVQRVLIEDEPLNPIYWWINNKLQLIEA